MGRPPPGVARAAFAIEQVGECLYLCGGTTEESDSKIHTRRVDIFHLPTQQWRRGPEMLVPRCNHGIVGLPNGTLAIGGGRIIRPILAIGGGNLTLMFSIVRYFSDRRRQELRGATGQL